MTWLIILLNVGGWPAIHLLLAKAFIACPDRCFERDSWLTRRRNFEENGKLYRNVLLVDRWKTYLPDGAPWLGGRSKRRVSGRSCDALSSFLLETRRAETAHWCMLLCTPIFFAWNPVWACGVMVVYGAAANLPCILAQRSNRLKLARILLMVQERGDMDGGWEARCRRN